MIVENTNPISVNVINGYTFLIPIKNIINPVIILKIIGKIKFRLILFIEVLRHAKSGAIPVKASKTSPNGISF